METKPATGTPPIEKNPILTFEEFTSRDSHGVPRHNNFYLHFCNDGMFVEGYKQQAYYKKFASKNPTMTKELNYKIQNKLDTSNGTAKGLEPFERDLYEAYKIMRSYGVSDIDLFS